MTAPYPLGLGLSFFNTQSFLQAKASLNGGLTLKAGGLSITNVTPGWVPTDLGTKLVGFIDATSNTNITQSGGSVSQITDTVSTAAFVQATGAIQPTLVTTSLGQVMRFSGAQQLTFTGIPTGWTTTGACEWWLVGTQSTSGTQTAFSMGVGANATQQGITTVNFPVTGTTAPGQYLRVSIGDGTTQFSSTGFAVKLFPNSSFAVRGTCSTTASTIFVNGIPDTSATAARNINTTRVRIGCNTANSATSFWNGDISAIAVTNAVLTGADLANMNYWAQTRAQVWK